MYIFFHFELYYLNQLFPKTDCKFIQTFLIITLLLQNKITIHCFRYFYNRDYEKKR